MNKILLTFFLSLVGITSVNASMEVIDLDGNPVKTQPFHDLFKVTGQNGICFPLQHNKKQYVGFLKKEDLSKFCQNLANGSQLRVEHEQALGGSTPKITYCSCTKGNSETKTVQPLLELRLRNFSKGGNLLIKVAQLIQGEEVRLAK